MILQTKNHTLTAGVFRSTLQSTDYPLGCLILRGFLRHVAAKHANVPGPKLVGYLYPPFEPGQLALAQVLRWAAHVRANRDTVNLDPILVSQTAQWQQKFV